MTADRRGPGAMPTAMPTPDSRRHRRPRLGSLAAFLGIGVLAVACTGSASGGGATYTYAPPASSGASMPGMDMSPSAGPPATSAPPAAAGSTSASPSTPNGSAPAAAGLRISAQNIKFDTNHLAAPAGQAFVLEFDNNDPGVPHNVEILGAGGTSLFKGQIVMGPATISYEVPALAPGSYTFLCDVHPYMTGTLTAK